jgi:hypothetical protein
MRKWNIGGMMVGRERLKYLEKNLPQWHSVYRNLIPTALRLVSGLYGKKRINNFLIYRADMFMLANDTYSLQHPALKHRRK